MVINDEKTLRDAINNAWSDYEQNEKKNKKRIAETTQITEINGKSIFSMTFGEATMKYSKEVVGQPGENGYPLYICLHGGGGSDTPDINNQQWGHMMIYYRRTIDNGIVVAPRGVRDTYDCHSNPESFPLYDELIENMILFENVDPNRVYLLGFSAGGDGVYQISVKMSDRFAAVNMSAGHPNGLQIENLCNLPIALQCGENDGAYNRNKVTAEYGMKLDSLQEKTSPDCYKHTVFIHSGKPHNYVDYGKEDQLVLADYKGVLNGITDTVTADANAVRFVSRFTRNPIPEKVEWNLTTRANMRLPESFYWLRADKSADHGMIHAEYNRTDNSITVSPEGVNGDFEILISPDMLNLFEPVTFRTPEGNAVISVNPDTETIKETTAERGDPGLIFAARISYRDIVNNIRV